MSLQRLLSGDPGRNSTIYLLIGVLSLVKAIAVRNDSNRRRRELIDAGLFIGLGLVLRRYSTLRAEKREELRASLPRWLIGDDGESGLVHSVAERRFRDEPQQNPSIRERATAIIS